ncbi:MAG: acyloxyacyl hydrolase [Opitutus sp.]|nr:acyloxyacyl hydrolase [Opitutus sp.]
MNCRARRVMECFLPALAMAVALLSAPPAAALDGAPRATARELSPPATANESLPPWETTELSVETGLLWQVGSNTPLSYRLVPTQLSWRSRAFFAWELASGGHLLVRHRLGLLATWVQQGPESHYLALHGSPSIELWNRTGTWALVGGAGGGFGLIDSRGVAGGQGQDFTLHWFGRVGVEHATTQGLRFSAGVMFQHMSNGGQTNPNPGIDALGFTLGLSRAF